MTQLEQATAQMVIAEECARAGVSIEDVRGKRRRTRIVAVRRRISRRLRDEVLLSYPAIGALLNRDHASIMSPLWVQPAIYSTAEVGGLS